MSVKLRHNSVLSQRTSTQCSVENWPKVHYLCNGDLNYIRCDRKHARKRSFIICAGSGRSKYRHIYTSSQSLKHQLVSNKSKKGGNHLLFASADDRVAVNGTAQGTSSSNVEAMRVKLDQSLQNEDYNNGLLQSLHDAARVFELSIKQSSLFKMSWFSAAWLGVDKNTWVKALSYQSAVYSLLQAANEISSCADGRERDVNAVLQRSLLRLSAPLESIVREKLSVKQPELFQWFWYEQVPVVVTTFVNHFERDPRFKAATVSGKRTSFGDNESDVSLLMLSLACAAAISKLGPAKVSCSQFFTMIPEITGKLMDMLVDLVPIAEAYQSVKEIGLHREFLVHFGPRAASAWVNDDCGTDETVFWVDLVQKQLQLAIDREKIWSRLTTFESIEVLERDLAIFGFFIALGRSTKSFLIANGFENIDEPIEGFIRYLIGGSVLYYPQLSSISSYQLYVEVVCEELDWLPFYPGYTNSLKGSHGHKGDIKSPPNVEAIPRALDVCSHWIQSLIKHSKWLRNPSNVKAARFLSKGHNKLRECKEVLGAIKKELVEDRDNNADGRTKHNSNLLFKEEPGSFEKALESVEEALLKLEKLLQELHVSSSKSEKNHLKAACSDLERIRKLKKEAEFLEASFRAKAASLQQGNDDLQSPSFANQQKKYVKHRNGGGVEQDRNNRDLRSSVGLWGFLFWPPTKETENGFSKALEKTDRGSPDPTLSCLDAGKSDSNEFHRFEILRSELMELEKRVKKSTNQPENVGDVMECPVEVGGTGLVTVQKNGNLIEKSFDKLKETTTDVWQGSQLLAIDVACAMGLLRRLLIGDELTEKEKNALRRTLTDLASVVPIGVLMLLPVTAVGHAAMLAAIQRYVPGLIPSTYGPERLYLLRQLEKMKEIEASDSDENVEEST